MPSLHPAGGKTVFILTWDDWGGYADHVPTPCIETLPDALHPSGFQAIGGTRIPLILFGGTVMQGIETTWHSHASIAKTAIDLLGLPPLGVPSVDAAPSLAGRIDTTLSRQVPPVSGSAITQPTPPNPRPVPAPTPPWPGTLNTPMQTILLNGGGTLPAPSDGIVRATPPSLPLLAPHPTTEVTSRQPGAAKAGAAKKTGAAKNKGVPRR